MAAYAVIGDRLMKLRKDKNMDPVQFAQELDSEGIFFEDFELDGEGFWNITVNASDKAAVQQLLLIHHNSLEPEASEDIAKSDKISCLESALAELKSSVVFGDES
ncbi:MAG: hypothetical protein EOM64_10670 [Erysipelotrichia bacterium]|nr:hypothetical protein [Erysipelotrichia bacterium]